MNIIPAIDLYEGKVVRLIKGDYSKMKIYSDSPLTVAMKFEKAGINTLHLVDLEGAISDTVVNMDSIEEIVKGTGLKIHFGGGVKSEGMIKKLLKMGISRVVIGTKAITEPDFVLSCLEKFGSDTLIPSIDLKNNKPCSNGWRDTHDIDFNLLLDIYYKKAKFLMSTDILSDGTMTGVNANFYKKLVQQRPSFSIIASGGVAGVDDLKLLSDAGCWGAVIGKSIYENIITIEEIEKHNNLNLVEKTKYVAN
ncbi:MAG: 1-(5-phosphoribosyl)-5-[(5-phosphoribosylamino)methylideneamino] imidazole-4-carboxamide isomerase [Saprospiraceae bacterium]|nr:1-(5-phosphoribosyl)-5-[(5-phosphoribosylamino)methylideneamino] imidazole-4-carboxamide isomerase [Candidatus Defluviibacterium haderslevense]